MKLRSSIAVALALALSGCVTATTPGRVSGAPAGCPRTLFCGCDLSLKIFGRIVRKPNLMQARVWGAAFRRAEPAPGMVAVGRRRGGGHVFELLSHVGGDVWLAYDPNSGGHQTHVHERSIAGHIIVDPRSPLVSLQ